MARAIASGRVGLISGTKEKVRHSREVKESVDRAIALDPNNALAYHIRGRWHYEVASLGFFARAALNLVYGGLPDASYEQALQDLQRANAIEDLVINHVELGKTYLKLDEEAEARAAFQRALDHPSVYPKDDLYKEQARERFLPSYVPPHPQTPIPPPSTNALLRRDQPDVPHRLPLPPRPVRLDAGRLRGGRAAGRRGAEQGPRAGRRRQ